MSKATPSSGTGLSAVCSYCGNQLDRGYYFCRRCAKPYRSVESVLPAVPPPYADLETRLRVDARPAWTVFFVYLSVIAVVSLLAAACWGMDHPEPAQITLGLALLVTTSVFLVRYWPEVRPLLARAGLGSGGTWLGMALLAPLLALNYGYHHSLMELFDSVRAGRETYFASWWGSLLFLCVMPAVVEEIGFRGIIQHQLEKAVSPAAAITAAALAFSAAHFAVLSAPYLALAGALFGWMKWKSGSLYPAMAAHFTHNLIVIQWF